MIRIMSAHCDPLVVVVAPGAESWLNSTNAIAAVNPDPDRGMLSSLQCGLRLLGHGPGHIVFTPMDLPSLSESTVAAVAHAAAQAEVVIPRYKADRGHPVAISRAVARELLALDPLSATANPKDVLRRDDARVLFLDLDDPGAVRDIDEPKDYQDLLQDQQAAARA
jgi:molybdenum cofactor cytidylyltransferase